MKENMIKLHSDGPQKVLIELDFTTTHNPGNEEHLDVILENYFRAKGIKFEDGKIIV